MRWQRLDALGRVAEILVGAGELRPLPTILEDIAVPDPLSPTEAAALAQRYLSDGSAESLHTYDDLAFPKAMRATFLVENPEYSAQIARSRIAVALARRGDRVEAEDLLAELGNRLHAQARANQAEALTYLDQYEAAIVGLDELVGDSVIGLVDDPVEVFAAAVRACIRMGDTRRALRCALRAKCDVGLVENVVRAWSRQTRTHPDDDGAGTAPWSDLAHGPSSDHDLPVLLASVAAALVGVGKQANAVVLLGEALRSASPRGRETVLRVIERGTPVFAAWAPDGPLRVVNALLALDLWNGGQ